MTLSVHLPAALAQKLTTYCAAHHSSPDEVVQEALQRLLAPDAPAQTPFERGRDGFGADRIHGGEIARESKRLLRMKFRGQSPG